MEKRIFFFDIDGTLYDPALGGLPPSTKDALRQLFGHGHRVYIATSRARGEMHNVARHLAPYPFHGYIYSGGAELWQGERVETTHPLEPEDAALAMAYCAEKGILARWQTGAGVFFTAPPTEQIEQVQHQLFGAVPQVRPWQGEQVLRMAVYAQPQEMNPLCAQAQALCCLPMAPKVSELARCGVDKASAMLEQVAREGFAQAQAVAFGDGTVDATMLRQAGVGVAMGNSDPLAQACADYVTSPISRGGIYQACRHFGWL